MTTPFSDVVGASEVMTLRYYTS